MRIASKFDDKIKSRRDIAPYRPAMDAVVAKYKPRLDRRN
jgi:hypothetical protein